MKANAEGDFLHLKGLALGNHLFKRINKHSKLV